MQIKILNQIALAALILSLPVVYFFSMNARHAMKEEALYWEGRSSLVKSLLPGFKSEGEMAGFLDKKYRELNLIASRRGQNIPEVAADYAQKMNIRITDIKAYPAQALKQENNSAVVINSRVVKSLLVRLEGDCSYMNLVKYIAVLQRVTPALVTVERLNIKKDKRDPGQLKVVLELRFYGLSFQPVAAARAETPRLKHGPQSDQGMAFLWEKSAGDQEVKRDPFLHGSSDNGLSLKGIIWGPDRPSAVINERVVGIGDVIGNLKVTQITQDSVVLENEHSKLELKLSQ
jgi:hypothetical protein